MHNPDASGSSGKSSNNSQSSNSDFDNVWIPKVTALNFDLPHPCKKIVFNDANWKVNLQFTFISYNLKKSQHYKIYS